MEDAETTLVAMKLEESIGVRYLETAENPSSVVILLMITIVSISMNVSPKLFIVVLMAMNNVQTGGSTMEAKFKDALSTVVNLQISGAICIMYVKMRDHVVHMVNPSANLMQVITIAIHQKNVVSNTGVLQLTHVLTLKEHAVLSLRMMLVTSTSTFKDTAVTMSTVTTILSQMEVQDVAT
jgi:hypothetical protein